MEIHMKTKLCANLKNWYVKWIWVKEAWSKLYNLLQRCDFLIQMCFIAFNCSSQSVILMNFFFSLDFWLIDLYWLFKVKLLLCRYFSYVVIFSYTALLQKSCVRNRVSLRVFQKCYYSGMNCSTYGHLRWIHIMENYEWILCMLVYSYINFCDNGCFGVQWDVELFMQLHSLLTCSIEETIYFKFMVLYVSFSA